MRTAILAACLAASGCASHRPRWEVQVTVQVETRFDQNTKADATVTLRRPASPREPTR